MLKVKFWAKFFLRSAHDSDQRTHRCFQSTKKDFTVEIFICWCFGELNFSGKRSILLKTVDSSTYFQNPTFFSSKNCQYNEGSVTEKAKMHVFNDLAPSVLEHAGWKVTGEPEILRIQAPDGTYLVRFGRRVSKSFSSSIVMFSHSLGLNGMFRIRFAGMRLLGVVF